MILHPRRDAWESLLNAAVQAELPIPAIVPNRLSDGRVDIVIKGHVRIVAKDLLDGVERALWYVRGVEKGRSE